jgi:MoxR-like ATPase
MSETPDDDVKAVEKLGEARDAIVAELRKTIVGMDDVIDEMMIAIFARGHCLLVGVPGLAKTLLVSSLAQTMSLSFKRIQFTPDLMPSDITGTELLQEDPETHERRFQFQKGPVFTNLLLADEINRTPPKTQAALLEAMQEKRVSSGGEDYKLDEPFFVLATQNPIEQEGTYPLPEAQLDRFLFNIMVKYPDRAEELDIMKSVTSDDEPELKEVVGGAAILEFQHVVRRIPVADHIFEYAASLVRATRPDEADAPDFVKQYMAWGAGPRASLNLILAGKARAALRGRCHVSTEDIQAVCLPILRHRIIPNFAARSGSMTADTLIERLLEHVPADEKLYEKKAG